MAEIVISDVHKPIPEHFGHRLSGHYIISFRQTSTFGSFDRAFELYITALNAGGQVHTQLTLPAPLGIYNLQIDAAQELVMLSSIERHGSRSESLLYAHR
jgi:hypothetical protein